ncbi:MAG: LarC family nickel insertion protein, partial [Candidatus Eisenbacteria bacterium]|nr:LarC family nickel insertion protein [Candidatus Eisenbacteria bacterium]
SLPGLKVDAAGAVAMVGVHVGIAQLTLRRHWRTPLGVAPASLAGMGSLLVGTHLTVLPDHFAGVSSLGVALALSLADVHDSPVSFHLQTVGTGTGRLSADPRISTLPLEPHRVTVAIGSAEAGTDVEQAFEVCATVDDMDPELVPPLMSSLRESGALDAWWSPAVTRGGRPAVTLHALCAAERLAAVRGTILRESTTIGLRYHAVTRHVLPRATRSVETDAGVVAIKESTLPDGTVRWKAELEDCRRVALAAGLTVAQVRELVRKSLDARSTS